MNWKKMSAANSAATMVAKKKLKKAGKSVPPKYDNDADDKAK